MLVSLVTSKETANVVPLTCSTSNFSFKVILLVERWVVCLQEVWEGHVVRTLTGLLTTTMEGVSKTFFVWQ